jgi:magnesium transporter
MSATIRLFSGSGIQTTDAQDLPKLLKDKDALLWIDITGPQEEDVRLMQEVFHFHPLAIEDTRNQKQRPKAEEFEDHIFIILNPISDPSDGDDLFRELDVFVGKNYLVTVHPAAEPVVDEMLHRLTVHQTRMIKSSSRLLHLLMDTIVDDYFPCLEKLEDDIENLASRIVNTPDQDILNQIFRTKHMLNAISRVVLPQQDITSMVMNHDLVFIEKDNLYHLRDVHDHLLRIADMVHTQRDNLNSLINLHVSATSNRLNFIVNRLTLFTIVIGVLTVISGFYGMNFETTFPPFDREWGVPFVLGMMGVMIIFLLEVLRRRRWF